jgi:predicted RNA binding protein YcfA (HicA-like mRNA interferase family)
MPKLPRAKASEVIQALQKLGFVKVRQKGSHVILKKTVLIEDKPIEIGCVVPLHNKTIAVGTLNNILSQAQISAEDLINNL